MSEVAYHEGSWAGQRCKRSLSYRMWLPPHATGRALLVIIHGFGEHSGRYQGMASQLATHGLCVACADLPGHGRSEGRRGDIPHIGALIQDLKALAEERFLRKCGQTRYTLFGHSFGGLVAIRWALGGPSALERFIVQSPLLEVGFPIPRWKTSLSAALAACWPTASFSMNLDLGAISADPVVVEAYRTDPLVHHVMTARTYHAILLERDAAFERASALHVPLLLLLGTADRIISIDAARRWFDRVACEKSLVEFPGCYHELHHEPVKDDVMRLVCTWSFGVRRTDGEAR